VRIDSFGVVHTESHGQIPFSFDHIRNGSYDNLVELQGLSSLGSRMSMVLSNLKPLSFVLYDSMSGLSWHRPIRESGLRQESPLMMSYKTKDNGFRVVNTMDIREPSDANPCNSTRVIVGSISDRIKRERNLTIALGVQDTEAVDTHHDQPMSVAVSHPQSALPAAQASDVPGDKTSQMAVFVLTLTPSDITLENSPMRMISST